MVKVIGRVQGSAGELAYKVMAKGYSFEVAVYGKQFRIKHVPEGRLPMGYLGSAFEEVVKWLQAAAMAARPAIA